MEQISNNGTKQGDNLKDCNRIKQAIKKFRSFKQSMTEGMAKEGKNALNGKESI